MSFVAGVMGTDKLFPYNFISTIGTYGSIKDFNNATETGWYRVSGTANESGVTILNKPSEGGYGFMEVRKYGTDSSASIVQIFHGVFNNQAVMVRHYSSGEWTAWSRTDNFGYNTLDELAAALKPLLGL